MTKENKLIISSVFIASLYFLGLFFTLTVSASSLSSTPALNKVVIDSTIVSPQNRLVDMGSDQSSQPAGISQLNVKFKSQESSNLSDEFVKIVTNKTNRVFIAIIAFLSSILLIFYIRILLSRRSKTRGVELDFTQSLIGKQLIGKGRSSN